MTELQAFFTKEKCFWCDGPMFDRAKLDEHPDLLARFQHRVKTRDHLIPLKDGGAGYTVAACWLCNHKKGSMDPMVFRDKHRPHIPVEKVVAALMEAKFANAEKIPKPKKKVTRRKRVIRYFLTRRQKCRQHTSNP